jgi:hypothetical protein
MSFKEFLVAEAKLGSARDIPRLKDGGNDAA